MNNSSNHHEPSAEFRAQLKREIARAVRSDHLFGPPPAPVRTRRFVMALGIAGGVALTLFAGMILGASASYASAAEPDATRPTLAIRPISNALSAIGCGVVKAEPQVRKTTRVPAPVQQPPAVGIATDSTPPAARRDPDRRKIAALASQHQPHVVRGDTAAEYIVMVLDATEKYMWSTYGSGNLSIEVGGDRRTRAERLAYTREFSAEFGNPVVELPTFAAYIANMPVGAGGARGGAPVKWLVADSLHRRKTKFAFDSLVMKDYKINGAKYFRRGDDSIAPFFRKRDSTGLRELVAGLIARSGDAGGGRGDGGRGGSAAAMDTATVYKAGWSGTPNGSLTNQATGLDPSGSGNGNSGVIGLPSAWIAMSETYFFGPAELAPQAVKVLVLRLTPGTVWGNR